MGDHFKIVFNHYSLFLWELRIAAALLIAYWHRDNEHVAYWIGKSLSDCVMEFGKYGTGSDFDLAKFGLVEQEERDRKVIGLSAANKCLVLNEMVEHMANEIGGSPSQLT